MKIAPVAGRLPRMLRATTVVCVLSLVFSALSCLGARNPAASPEGVRRLLTEGDVTGAMSAAGEVTGADKREAAEALMGWAEEHRDDAYSRLLAQVLDLVIELDPMVVAAYADLGLLTAESRLLMSFAESGLASWEKARRRYPELREDPAFVRAGTVLAAASSPLRPDILCDSGASIEPDTAPFGVVLDAELPAGLRDVQLTGAAGGWVALVAQGPDGQGTGIIVSSADGAVARRLYGCLDLRLSPTGRYAAWVRELSGPRQLDCLVLDTATGDSQVLAALQTGRTGYFGLAWSPDETELAIASVEGLKVTALDGSPCRVVDELRSEGDFWRVAGHPQWISTGTLAARVVSNQEVADPVWTFGLVSGTKKEVPVDVLHWSLQDVLWSPDGRYVACNIGDGKSQWIQVIEPATTTGRDTLAAYGEVEAQALAWSPDSKTILLSMRSAGYSPPWGQLWLWDREGGRMSFLCRDWVQSATWGSGDMIYWVAVQPYSGDCRLTGARLRCSAADVRRLLDEGSLDDALAMAEKTDAGEMPSVVETLARWAAKTVWGPTRPDGDRARVYALLITIDPECVEAFAGLAALVAQYPELNDPGTRLADRALDAWEAASRDYPQLLDDPLFVRAGTILGAAVGSDRPDALAKLAKSGQLAGAELTVVLDCPVPSDVHVHEILGVAGGLLAFRATDQSGEAIGCVASTSNGAIKWRLEDCFDMLLSPTGRYAVWTKSLPREGPREVFILDTQSGASRTLATLGFSDLSYSAAWSPDERRLAFSTDEGLILIDSDGRNRRTVAPVGGTADSPQLPARLEWIDRGALLGTSTMAPSVPPYLFAGIDPVRVIDLESGTTRRIHVNPINWWLGGGLWSPDGRLVACDIGQDCPGWIQAIAPASTPAGDVLVTFGGVSSSVVSWSPDSSKLLLYMGIRDDPESTRLWLWDRDSGRLMLLLDHGGCWSAVWGDDGVIYWIVTDPDLERERLVGAKLNQVD